MCWLLCWLLCWFLRCCAGWRPFSLFIGHTPLAFGLGVLCLAALVFATLALASFSRGISVCALAIAFQSTTHHVAIFDSRGVWNYRNNE